MWTRIASTILFLATMTLVPAPLVASANESHAETYVRASPGYAWGDGIKYRIGANINSLHASIRTSMSITSPISNVAVQPQTLMIVLNGKTMRVCANATSCNIDILETALLPDDDPLTTNEIEFCVAVSKAPGQLQCGPAVLLYVDRKAVMVASDD
jgi:hypothetical protein